MSSPLIEPYIPGNIRIEPPKQGVVVHRDAQPLFASAGYARVYEFSSVDEVLALESLEPLFSEQDKYRLQMLESARSGVAELPGVFEFTGQSHAGFFIPLLCNPTIVEWDGELAIQQTVTDLSGVRTTAEHLKNDDGRYRTLFQQTPIGLWEEDWSAVKKLVDKLQLHEREHLADYIATHPDFLFAAVAGVRIVDINDATIELYSGSDRQLLLASMNKELRGKPSPGFAERLAAFAAGRRRASSEGWEPRFAGGKYFVRITMTIPDGHEDDWSLLVGSAQDFTEREHARDKEHASASLLQNIRLLQSDYIAGMPALRVFARFMSRLVALTDSYCGCFGEVLFRDDGAPYIKSEGFTTTTLDEQSRFHTTDPSHGIETYQQDTLFAQAHVQWKTDHFQRRAITD